MWALRFRQNTYTYILITTGLVDVLSYNMISSQMKTFETAALKAHINAWIHAA